MNEELNQARLVEEQLNLLLNEGIALKVPKRSLLRYLGKKERTFLIRPPYLGTLDRVTREFVRMDLSEDELKQDWIGESKRLAARSTWQCARIVAMAYLNGPVSIRLFTPLVAYYFLWHLTPDKLFQVAQTLNLMLNLGSFTNSIRIWSAVRTYRIPSAMEEEQGD